MHYKFNQDKCLQCSTVTQKLKLHPEVMTQIFHITREKKKKEKKKVYLQNMIFTVDLIFCFSYYKMASAIASNKIK